jgi:hypothetical protein
LTEYFLSVSLGELSVLNPLRKKLNGLGKWEDSILRGLKPLNQMRKFKIMTLLN